MKGLIKTVRPSRIEYLDLHWPIVTGCDNTARECATWEKCWARSLHRRFGKRWTRLYNPEFKAQFNPDELNVKFPSEPYRIGAAFTGDLFSEGITEGQHRKVLEVVVRWPQHTFLFLTKRPDRLAILNPWPENAWVGVSVCGDGGMTLALTNLANVKGGKRWLSIEPLLGAITMRSHELIVDWVVLGAQSGGSMPRVEWIHEITEAAARASIPVWLKENLYPFYQSLRKRQEVPHA